MDERDAREHLGLIGPRLMLRESIEGMIEAAIDAYHSDYTNVRAGEQADYAALCFDMALESLIEDITDIREAKEALEEPGALPLDEVFRHVEE